MWLILGQESPGPPPYKAILMTDGIYCNALLYLWKRFILWQPYIFAMTELYIVTPLYLSMKEDIALY